MINYNLLTEYLKNLETDKITLSLDEIESILKDKLPDFVYTRKPYRFFDNNIKNNSYAKYWHRAGYSARYKTNINSVLFVKDEIIYEDIAKNHTPKRDKNINKKSIPSSLQEEILLDVPANLEGLELDEYLMVKLSPHNRDIIENCIENDPMYRHIGYEAFEYCKAKGEFDKDAYYEIVKNIATENSTRTSTDTMLKLANYLSDKKNRFLERLKSGDIQLVDDIVDYLSTNNTRREKSLVSKVCKYMGEWLYDDDTFTINDSVVRDILPYYLAYYKIDKKIWQSAKLDKLSYVEFYHLFDMLHDKVNFLSRHELDHVIWYSYKSDAIRSNIAKALSKVL